MFVLTKVANKKEIGWLKEAKTAAELTGVRSVKELLSGFGSGVLEETEAVLVSVPAGVEGDTVPRMVRTMEAPLGNVRAG